MNAPHLAVSDHIAVLSADPVIRELCEAMAPLRVTLTEAGANPVPQRRDRWDSWGDDGVVFLGVPEGAGAAETAEALWQLRLLGAGWPDPLERPGDEGRIAMALLDGAARAWMADPDGPPAPHHERDLSLLVADLVASEQSERVLAVRIMALAGAHRSLQERVLCACETVAPVPARSARALLAQAGRLPLTPEEAEDAVGWLCA